MVILSGSNSNTNDTKIYPPRSGGPLFYNLNNPIPPSVIKSRTLSEQRRSSKRAEALGLKKTKEYHGLQYIPGVGVRTSNFCGPGTNILSRIKNGDVPVNETDRICMEHDIRFSLAQDADNLEIQRQLLRDADHIMINKAKKLAFKDFTKTDLPIDWHHPFQVFDSKHLGGLGIKNAITGVNDLIHASFIEAKVGAENLGLMKPEKFGGDLVKLSDEDRKLYTDALKNIDQIKTDPGEASKFGRTTGKKIANALDDIVKITKPTGIAGSILSTKFAPELTAFNLVQPLISDLFRS